MSVPSSLPDRRRVVASALLASILGAVGVVTVSWVGRVSAGTNVLGGSAIAGAITSGLLSVVWFVPFLLAVLVVVASPTPRAVAGGAALVYTVDLLLSVFTRLTSPFPLDPTIAVASLTRVAIFLGVTTAVWIAYHGGYERLTAPLPDSEHPLFAVVAHDRIGPALSLQRGLVAAVVAGFVAAAGLVLVGVAADLLRSLFLAGPGRGRIVVAGSAGLSLSQLPRQWLFEASFLLAVLFVTGPRTAPRDLLKGVAVLFGVQSTARLLPSLLPPFRPADLWESGGPVLAPLGDTITLVAITVAVWLAFRGGIERLRARSPATGTMG